MYSRKKIPFRVKVLGCDEPYIDVMAYPITDEFYPPFKWVLHRSIGKVFDRRVAEGRNWVVTDRVSSNAVKATGHRTIKEALAFARKTLTDTGLEKVSAAIAKATFGE